MGAVEGGAGSLGGWAGDRSGARRLRRGGRWDSMSESFLFDGATKMVAMPSRRLGSSFFSYLLLALAIIVVIALASSSIKLSESQSNLSKNLEMMKVTCGY